MSFLVISSSIESIWNKMSSIFEKNDVGEAAHSNHHGPFHLHMSHEK